VEFTFPFGDKRHEWMKGAEENNGLLVCTQLANYSNVYRLYCV